MKFLWILQKNALNLVSNLYGRAKHCTLCLRKHVQACYGAQLVKQSLTPAVTFLSYFMNTTNLIFMPVLDWLNLATPALDNE